MDVVYCLEKCTHKFWIDQDKSLGPVSKRSKVREWDHRHYTCKSPGVTPVLWSLKKEGLCLETQYC